MHSPALDWFQERGLRRGGVYINVPDRRVRDGECRVCVCVLVCGCDVSTWLLMRLIPEFCLNAALIFLPLLLLLLLPMLRRCIRVAFACKNDRELPPPPPSPVAHYPREVLQAAWSAD